MKKPRIGLQGKPLRPRKEAKNLLSRPYEKTANLASGQTSTVTYICGHRLLHTVRKAGESRNTRSPKEAKNFVSRPCKTKPQIWTSRQTSSVAYICGHRLLRIVRKAGESRNTRSTKDGKKFLPLPCERTANLDFKTNLFGHL